MRNRIIPYKTYLKIYARKLRKESQISERILWSKIRRRALGVQFHRQLSIDNYIVDFYCHELLLAIEVDGFASHGSAEQKEKDRIRQQRLESLGVHFIRFTDTEVKRQMPMVLRGILDKIDELRKG